MVLAEEEDGVACIVVGSYWWEKGEGEGERGGLVVVGFVDEAFGCIGGEGERGVGLGGARG